IALDANFIADAAFEIVESKSRNPSLRTLHQGLKARKAPEECCVGAGRSPSAPSRPGTRLVLPWNCHARSPKRCRHQPGPAALPPGQRQFATRDAPTGKVSREGVRGASWRMGWHAFGDRAFSSFFRFQLPETAKRAQVNMSSGRNADTMALGTSTTWLIRKSAVALQMA